MTLKVDFALLKGPKLFLGPTLHRTWHVGTAASPHRDMGVVLDWVVHLFLWIGRNSGGGVVPITFCLNLEPGDSGFQDILYAKQVVILSATISYHLETSETSSKPFPYCLLRNP